MNLFQLLTQLCVFRPHPGGAVLEQQLGEDKETAESQVRFHVLISRVVGTGCFCVLFCCFSLFFIHSSSVRMFPHRLIGSLVLREMFPSNSSGRWRRSVGGWVDGRWGLQLFGNRLTQCCEMAVAALRHF